MVAAGFSGRMTFQQITTHTTTTSTHTHCSLGAHSANVRLQQRVQGTVWTPVVHQQRQRRRNTAKQVYALQFFRTTNANNSSTSVSAAETLASAPVATEGAELYVQDAARLAGLAPPTFVQATGRVVASTCDWVGWGSGCCHIYCTITSHHITVGDIHGDLPKAIRALEVAGVLGEQDGRPLWTGGDTTVVQLGDVLDRGDCEIGIYYWW